MVMNPPTELAAHHLADLRRSGLSDETIVAAGFYSISAEEVAALLGRDDAGSGMAIPYPNCTFSNGTPYVRVRLDVPLVIDGHSVRYLTKKGERNRLYVPSILPGSVLADPSIPLVITEGEKKALKACQEGIRCVGLAGVWCWKTKIDGRSVPLPDLDLVVWPGRLVVIAFDSDSQTKPSVRTAQSRLAKELSARGARVHIVELPSDPDSEKVGLDDYLVAHSRVEFEALVEAAPLWEPSRKSAGHSDEERGSQADRLVALVMAEGVELFHDQFGDAFALVPVGEHREIWPCRGKGLRRWLAGRFWRAEQKAANSEALGSALNVIEAQALFEGGEHELHNRVALHNGAIWYDLTDRDWRAVRITAQGWEVVSSPPILFRRYSHQQPQLEPVRGGDLHELRRFVNLRDEAHFLLCEVYLVCCVVPDIPHPIPDVHGGQGTAKTTLLRVLRKLMDPSAVEVLALPHDRAQLVQQLAHHWAPYYDNITHLPDWASDALCRAATGAGMSKRELYSDDDDVIYQFRRCPGLNGINTAAQKPDLLDRCLLFELEEIPKSERRPEQQFWAEFEQARPGLLGAILDALSRSMALKDSIRLPGLPRMADFAVWGCAAAQALGHSQDDFLEAYDSNMEIRNDEALQASSVATMVVALMDERERWEGSPSELLGELETLASQCSVNTKTRGWPKAAHSLSRELNRVRPSLAAAGISIERYRDGHKRWVRLQKTTGDSVTSVTSVTETSAAASEGPVGDGVASQAQVASPIASHDSAPADAEDDARDASDACDAISLPIPEGETGPGHIGPMAQAAGVALLTDGPATTAVSGIPNEAEIPPIRAPGPCYACGGTRFWRSVHGPVFCGTCHRPASEDLVDGWLQLDGEPEEASDANR